MSLSFFGPTPSAPQPPSPIHILTPGEQAEVVSPIFVMTDINVEENGLIRITLIDDENLVLVRQLLKFKAVPERPLPFETLLPFEIPRETSQALLTVEIEDEFQRPLALRSIALTLQSTGTANIMDDPIQQSWLTITEPQPFDAITGGEVQVKGFLNPLNEKPIIFELITDTGGVIGSKQLSAPKSGEDSAFEVTIPYHFITCTRNVRLVIRQRAEGFPHDRILDSLLLSLTP